MEVGTPGRRRWPVRVTGPHRRTTDRVEDAVAWLLVSLALLTTVVAAGAGMAAHDAALERLRADPAGRTPVRAVLLEPSPGRPLTLDGAAEAPPAPTAARWTTAQGVAVTGEVPVTVRRPAGAEVTIWLDPAGRVVPSPPGADAQVTGWTHGLALVSGGWSVLALTWVGVRRLTGSRNAAGWARDWARVEPVWSGRAGPEIPPHR